MHIRGGGGGGGGGKKGGLPLWKAEVHSVDPICAKSGNFFSPSFFSYVDELS